MTHSRTATAATITGVICVASAGILGGFLYILNGIKADLSVEEQAVFEIKDRQGKLNAMERFVAEVDEERAELEELVLTEDGVVDFLTTIENIGTTLGLSIETRSLTVVPGKGEIEDITMSIIIEGTEGGVTQALRILESLPYRSTLERMSFTISEAKAEWQATVDVRVAKYKKS